MRAWLMGLGLLAGLLGAAGVALAAAGAHLSQDPIVKTAAAFLLVHAAALVAFCVVAWLRPTTGVLVAASLIAAGVVLFSGDLALRGLAGIVVVHMAAPTGGALLVAGWLTAAAALPHVFRHAPGASPNE